MGWKMKDVARPLYTPTRAASMKPLLLFAAAILLFPATAGAQESPATSQPFSSNLNRSTAETAALNTQKTLEARRHAYGAEEPSNVSMLQLITTPEKYQGKLVRVIAFLRIEFEGNALYLHQEDYEHGIHENAIWLDVDRSVMPRAWTISNQYVIAEGRFDGLRKGHMDLFSGTLGELMRLDPWSIKEPQQPAPAIPARR